jgi:hypothetical protein
MLVVARGDIVFTRTVTPSKDRVHLVKTGPRLLRPDGVDFDFHLASLRQIDRFHGAEDSVLINRVDIAIAHGTGS